MSEDFIRPGPEGVHSLALAEEHVPVHLRGIF